MNRHLQTAFDIAVFALAIVAIVLALDWGLK